MSGSGSRAHAPVSIWGFPAGCQFFCIYLNVYHTYIYLCRVEERIFRFSGNSFPFAPDRGVRGVGLPFEKLTTTRGTCNMTCVVAENFRGSYLLDTSRSICLHYKSEIEGRTPLTCKFKVTTLTEFRTCVSIMITSSGGKCRCEQPAAKRKYRGFYFRQTFIIKDEEALTQFGQDIDTVSECAQIASKKLSVKPKVDFGTGR